MISRVNKWLVGTFISVAIIAVMVGFTYSDQGLKPVEFVKWVEDVDNGLRQEQEVGGLLFSIQYKPLEYMAVKQEKDPQVKEEKVNALVEKFDGMEHFTFQIETNIPNVNPLKAGIQNTDEYYQRIEYFSFRMKDDLRLIDGQDTIPCTLYHFERTYDLAPYSKFVLGFKTDKDASEEGSDSDKKILYNDRIYGFGKIEFKVDAKDIGRVPKLITG